MMTEISLNVLDIAENSTRAGAGLVEIDVHADPEADRLVIRVADDGCGMTPEQVSQVTDPFFTTRKTRRIGLGVPFFKQAAELTGGSFSISSEVGRGTTVTAEFVLSSIDRAPLGDMEETMRTLITCHTETDFLYTYTYGDKSFTLDTREMRELLGDVPFDAPEISDFILAYLRENRAEADNGIAY